MISREELFEQAQLAEASYADFSKPTQTTRQALVDNNFSPSQAEEFIKHWKVAHHLPNTDTGFSATLFESLDNPGEFTFAIRGTEPLAGFGDDLAADIGDIAIDGLALKQIVDMYNYWQWLNAPKGSTYQVARLQSLGVYLPVSGQIPADISDGVVVDNPGGELKTIVFESSDVVYAATDDQALGLGTTTGIGSIDVTGHSLGGHLAMAFTRLFPETNPVAYTINGAGFRLDYPNVDNLFNMLAQRGTQFESSRILNLYGSAGPEVVTQDWGVGLSQLGGQDGHEEVFTESYDLGNTVGHGSPQMTDSLAVYDLFFRLSTSLSSATPAEALSTLKPLLEAASNQAETTLESLVGALYDLFVSPGGTPSKIAEGDREGLYQHINAIRDAITGLPPMGFELLIGKSQDDLVELAKNDIAYRYALKQLNPFAILGNDGLYRFDQNENGALDLYDPETGIGMTEEYLSDRARFLVLKVRLGITDNEQEFFSPEGNSTFKAVERDLILHTNRTHTQGLPKEKIIFDDRQSQRVDGGSAGDRLYGGDGVDFVYGFDGEDYIEGNVGDDHLIGGAGSDTLLGGEGDDTFYGGDEDGTDDKAHDTLKGGPGSDTYYVGNGDVIDDSDGDGKVFWKDTKLTGGKQAGSHVWISDDERFRYLFDPEGGERGTLTVWSGTDEAFEVKDFKPGELGIELEEFTSDNAPPTGGREIVGDGAPKEFSDGWKYDDLNNLIKDPAKPGPYSDGLNGSDGNDHIMAGLERDWVFAGEGDDLVEGGAGSDILQGEEGDDQIFSDAQIDLSQLESYAEFGGENGSGSEGDWLTGGLGDDAVVGGVDNDILFGGGGEDLILGGAGDDVLNGDDNYFWFDDSTVEESQDGNIFGALYISVYSHHYSRDVGAADIIYGGAGADKILGGQGNDLLYGESGDDIVSGSDGADILFGGSGDDKLTGEFNAGTGGDGVLPVPGNDYINGGAGDDWIQGEGGDDILYGGADNDQLLGDHADIDGALHGNDFLDGGIGNDILWGQGGEDTLLGGEGNDELQGDSGELEGDYHGNDLLYGDAGEDILWGQGGDDTLYGGADDDNLYGDHSSLEGQYHGLDILNGDDGDDQLVGGGGDDVLEGGEGDDKLFGDDPDLAADYHGNDVLLGGTGQDYLQGDGGDDQLIGGSGNDGLVGGEGNDTYIYAVGEGSDTISDESGSEDVLSLAASPSDVQPYQIGADLVLYFSSTGEQIAIQDWFGGDSIERIEFGDGSVWNEATILKKLKILGSDGDDSIDGSQRDDVIYGKDGDDTFTGGAGDDVMHGGSGDDVYLINEGDGRDTIQDESGANDRITLGVGITAASIKLIQSDNHLVINFVGTSDQVGIVDWFNEENRIETIEFADGAVYDVSQILAQVEANRNQVIEGTSGDDVLEGAGGNDVLAGGFGDDTYIYGLGGGTDIIDENAPSGGIQISDSGVISTGNDKLIFGAGIRPDQLRAERVDRDGGSSLNPNNQTQVGDLYIYVNDYDVVIVRDWYTDAIDLGTVTVSSPRIERFEFADGTIWDLPQIGQFINGEPITYAPIVNAPLPDQQIDQGQAFTYTVPADTFADPDGDALSYSATLDDGSPLPAWLSFDAANGGFIGTAEGDFTGILDIAVTATDVNGLSVVDTFRLSVGESDPVIYGGLGDEHLDGGSQDDTIDGGPGDDELQGKNGNDVLYGGTGNDRLTGDGRYDDVPGNDVLYGGEGNDDLFGYIGDDELYGGPGDDRISGSIGNDIIDGGPGKDHLSGGEGDDHYLFGYGSGFDIVDWDDSGVNRILLAEGVSTDDVSLHLDGRGLILALSDTRDQFAYGRYISYDSELGEYSAPSEHVEIQFADGTVWDTDTIFSKLNLPDIGSQTGTENDDIFEVDTPYDTIEETADGGVDRVESSASYTLPDNIENITLTGFLNTSATGNALDNVLVGNSGSNVLEGKGGRDRYIGGAGDDYYVLKKDDNLVDIIENENAGIDTIIYQDRAKDISLPDNVENLVAWVSGSRTYRIAGNELDNDIDISGSGSRRGPNGERLPIYYIHGEGGSDMIRGTDSADKITGGLGDDRLVGNAGEDILDGGEGVDQLLGGKDGDTYVFNIGDDSSTEGITTIIEHGDSLRDRIRFGAGITVADIRFEESGDDLIIHYSDTDKVLVEAGADGTVIDRYEFTDGGLYTHEEMWDLAHQDTAMSYGRGDGKITVTDRGGDDKIRFGEGIQQEDIDIVTRFNPDTVARIGGEFQINNYDISNIYPRHDDHYSPSVTALEDGGFEVVWTYHSDGGSYLPSSWYRHSQRFSASGERVGDEVKSLLAEGEETVSAVPSDSSSRVTVWNGQDESGSGIYAQRFDADGNKLGDEFLVNSVTDGNQANATVTVLHDGGFVIAWKSFFQFGSGGDVYAQRFDADGNRLGDEFLINSTTLYDQSNPSITTLNGGDLIVTWDSDHIWGEGNGIFAQRFQIGAESLTITVDGGSSDELVIENWSGDGRIESFEFADGTVLSSEEFLSLGNVSPLAVADRFETAENQPLMFAPDALLGNDSDGNGDFLRITDVSNVLHGSVEFDSRGNLLFTPETRFNGAASFDYQISDGRGGISHATATVEVTPVEHAPVVNWWISYVSTDEDDIFSLQLPADTFVDPDGDSLSLVATSGDGSPLPEWLSFDAATGAFSGTPGNDYTGTSTIEVTATDSSGLQIAATFDLAVENVNDVPVPGADTVSTDEDTPIIINATDLLANDTDIDGDSLSLTAVKDAVNGSVELTISGEVVFTPTPGFIGAASFDYVVDDGTCDPTYNSIHDIYIYPLCVDPLSNDPFDNPFGLGPGDIPSSTATQTVTVNVKVGSDSVNNVPTTGPDIVNTDEDTPLTISAASLLANDSDIDGDTLSLTSVTNAVNGSVELSETGDVVFTPTPNFSGEAGFDYIVDDGNGGAASQTVTVNVAAINDAPSVNNPLPDQNVLEGEELLYQLPENTFHDEDIGDSLRYSVRLSNGDPLPDWLSFDPSTGAFSGTPERSDAGGLEIEVTATDSENLHVTDNFILTVENVDSQTGTEGNDRIDGGSVNDVLDGAAGNDVLFGNEGNDTLQGGTGNDWLNGGIGADELDGGDGRDTAAYGRSAQGVQVNLSDGLGHGGDAEGDVLTNIERLSGSARNDDLTGDAGANSLWGRAGHDTLQGGAGNDWLDGGNGRDTAAYNRSAQGVQVNLSDGVGHGGDAEGDVLTNIERLSGSAHDDGLTGDAGANSLSGRAGDDTLHGGAGNDWLNGGTGADALDGGAGRDTAAYNRSAQGVQVSLSDGVGHGGDAEGDLLTDIERLSGSAHDDGLTGDAGANSLSGRAGDDTLHGGAGNDWLDGGIGADALDGGDGRDTAAYSRSAQGVQVSLSDGLGRGGDAEGDVLTDIERLSGSAHDDNLTGDAGANNLWGRAGHDTLHGGAGNDRLYGGIGADALDGGDGRDTAAYNSSAQGVQVSLADGLGHGGDAEGDVLTNIERLSGSAHGDDLTGDAGANSVSGRAGDDMLHGGAGNDWLNGGTGADALDGGDGRDTAAYSRSAQGVQVSLSDGLGHGGDAEGDVLTNIERLVGSAHDDDLTGDAGANSLWGRAGHDTLHGGTGNDHLQGGLGNDTYLFGRGDGQDLIVEQGGGEDHVLFGKDIASEQLWFRQDGEDLDIGVVGTDDRLRIDNWYTSQDKRVAAFETEDGSVLYESQVQQLVNAMAAFDPPASGETDLSPNTRQQLEPVLAAAWEG